MGEKFLGGAKDATSAWLFWHGWSFWSRFQWLLHSQIQYANPIEKNSRAREHRRRRALFCPKLHHQRASSIAVRAACDSNCQPDAGRLDGGRSGRFVETEHPERPPSRLSRFSLDKPRSPKFKPQSHKTVFKRFRCTDDCPRPDDSSQRVADQLE